MVPGWQQLLIVLVLVLILFGGRGRISSLMSDMAKGIKSFRKGLAEDDTDTPEGEVTTAKLEAQEGETVTPAAPAAAKEEPAKTE